MKPGPRLYAPFLLAAALMPAAHAQTGPWVDGEILVRSTLPSGQSAMFRVDPETGATAVLTTTQYWGGWSGSTVFDSYRGGVLSNMSLPPDSTFTFRLWLVSHDGTATAMPGLPGNVNVRALASAGDGRVFFIRHIGSTQGLTTVEYYDAGDQIQTLMDVDGVTPFKLDVEHLLYHAPSNALIGCSSAQWAITHCSPTGNSIYRVPLTPDGLKLAAPMTCTSVPTTFIYGELMGLDQLPNGNVMVPTASGFLGAPHGILTVDPVTLAIANWAAPQQYDLNGGFYSARLGRAVVHANSGSAWWEPDGLRTFAAGGSGFGTHVPTSLPIPGGGGLSPVEIVTEVDVNGPGCDGFQVPYGTGLAGNGSFVPQLGLIGCPDIGNPFTLAINGVNGGAPGLLGISHSSGAMPLFGGTLLLGPLLLTLPITASGMPGVAGAGRVAIPMQLNNPSLVGVDFYLQAGFLDFAAVQSISMSNGLRVQGG